jgi:hypothetical protein
VPASAPAERPAEMTRTKTANLRIEKFLILWADCFSEEASAPRLG